MSGIEFLDKFGAYRVIFPFFLILAVTYGILSQTKVFGENKNISVIISLIVAFVFVLSSKAVEFINTLIPFFITFLVLLFLFMLVTASTGVNIGDIASGVKRGGWFLVIIIMIVMTFVIMNLVFPEYNPETRTSGQEDEPINALGEILDIFFTPTVMGLIVLFAVFAVAAYVITIGK
ncbi:MAG: hypothetical protein JSW73_04800 [Candidatus Woesearchaeota archaeon]|nr:MAG: hypothetical protein JSW73_04800 [Candidatus Woesearchaeota archaeon]